MSEYGQRILKGEGRSSFVNIVYPKPGEIQGLFDEDNRGEDEDDRFPVDDPSADQDEKLRRAMSGLTENEANRHLVNHDPDEAWDASDAEFLDDEEYTIGGEPRPWDGGAAPKGSMYRIEEQGVVYGPAHPRSQLNFRPAEPDSGIPKASLFASPDPGLVGGRVMKSNRRFTPGLFDEFLFG